MINLLHEPASLDFDFWACDLLTPPLSSQWKLRSYDEPGILAVLCPNPWSRVVLEKLIVTDLVKKYLAFFWALKFIIVFIAIWIQSTLLHFISSAYILIYHFHLRLGLESGLQKIWIWISMGMQQLFIRALETVVSNLSYSVFIVGFMSISM